MAGTDAAVAGRRFQVPAVSTPKKQILITSKWIRGPFAFGVRLKARKRRRDMKRIIGLVCVLTLVLSVSAAAFNQADVDKLVAGETELAGADFSDLQLPRPKAPETKYRNMNLEGATFQSGNLFGRVFWNSNLKSTNFSGASLGNFHNLQCDFSRADFTGAKFPAVIINGSTMRNCNFANIDTSMTEVNALTQFRTTDISGSSFRNADLSMVSFFRCDLRGVDWSGATFSSMAYMGQCTLDENAKQYFNNTGIRLENNIWGSAPSSSGAIKVDPKAHSGVKEYKPATSKAVKKGMVIK